MTKRPVPVHYLRPNDAVWTPACVVFADTETRTREDGDTVVQSLRCWSARLVDRRPTTSGRVEDETADGETAAGMVAQLEAWLRGRDGFWLFCHNLAFDLAVTRLPILLAEAGWTVTDVAADSASPWMRLERRGKRITLVDSWSWLRKPLEVIGAAVGVVKPALPTDTDSPEAWAARCRSDVHILATAMLELMAWWEDTGKGRWSITGSASGWNAMRHTPTRTRVLVKPDPEGIAFDREAIHGGIRYVWRHGDLPPGAYTEVDIAGAYVTTAATQLLPVKRMREFDTYPIDGRLLAGDHFASVARVLICTDTPAYPVKIDGHVWHPVGRFWTTLAGPELAAARDAGHIVAVGRTWVHELGDALQPWARWCGTLAAGGDPEAPPTAVIAAKHWARAVIGKWSQRAFTKTLLGPSPVNGWGYEHAWNHDTKTRGAILDVAGRRWLTEASGDADNCYPAVLAFTESHVRAAVQRVIAALPAERLVQADTDGVILAGASQADYEAAQAAVGPYVIRPKKTYTRVKVLGPQHLVRDGVRKFAGVPSGAVLSAGGALEATLWPRLSTQMATGSPDGFVQTRARILMKPTYAPGWVLVDGRVLPLEVHTDAARVNHIVPWPMTRHALAGEQLGPDQHQLLNRYHTPPTRAEAG